MSNHPVQWIITCEHGGNDIPKPYRRWFDSKHASRMLSSHRGYDPGAWQASIQFADGQANQQTGQGQAHQPNAIWIGSQVSRLLVDLNRSESSEQLMSRFVADLSPPSRRKLLDRWYTPYRQRVREAVGHAIETGNGALHLSMHTFTPRIGEQRRAMDVGLLFDPDRVHEAKFCERWIAELATAEPRLRVRANQPYAGTDDGLTTWLRTQFSGDAYLGIEIEICNRFYRQSPQRQERIVAAMMTAVKSPGAELARDWTTFGHAVDMKG